VEFIYLDNESTKKFLRNQGWLVFPEPTPEESKEVISKQRNIADNYDLDKYIVKKKKTHTTNDNKKKKTYQDIRE
jgi:hypothetical protein